MPNLKVLGEKLKDLRNNHGMSQDFVAQELGLSRQAIISIESGKRKVDSFELFKLTKLLNADMESLLSEEGISSSMKVREGSVCYRRGSNFSELEQKALNEFEQISKDYEFLKNI